jgi:uncharacterized DUF497 family protein
MADDEYALEFPIPVSFEWDEEKNILKRAKHGIDFDDAMEIFYGPIVSRRSDRNNEERWIAVGYSENLLIARIISARRARKNEEREYRNQEMGRPP